MTIQGAAGLYNLLTSIGMCDRDVMLRRITDCVIDLQSGCSCHRRADKIQKHKNCNKLYYDAVNSIIPILSNEIFKKTTDREIIFLDESGKLLKTISR